MKDYYKILGVKANASPEDIHTRWIELMRKFHPDMRSEGGAEDERIKEVNEAYDVLKHSSARSRYDLQRAYYQKKRSLHLQRFILPPTVLLALLFLGLMYFLKPNATPSPESTVPSVRRIIQINRTNQINAVNDTNDLNDLNAPNAPNDLHSTDQINQIDQTDEIHQINQINRANPRKPTRRGAKAKTSSKIHESARARTDQTNKKDQPDPKNKNNRINQINEIDQIDETGQMDQTNQIKENNPANRTSASKGRKAPLVFAKAKNLLKVQKLASSPKQLNKINQINQTNEIDQIDQTDEIDQRDDPNELNHLSQLTPPSLIATEEEVKNFLAIYRLRYNRKDIDALLLLFSPSAVMNQRDGFDEIKEIYSDFFDQSKELRYYMEDTRIQIFQNAVEVTARYEIDQIRKYGRGKKVWRGEIRWILVKEDRALKIRFLDFRPLESR